MGLEFGEGVDPDGVLARIRGQDLIHAADNRVEYRRQLEQEETTR